MNALLLVLTTLGISVQHVAKKTYNNKVSGGAYTFAAASALFAMPVFLIYSLGVLNFTCEILPYSIAFAVSYGMALVFSLLAISSGPLSLTCLITQYSLLIPTFYGLIFLKETYKNTLFVGILLLVVSVVFVNLEKKDEKKITAKWTFFVLLAFLGNGVCSTVQKVMGLDFQGEYKSEFMIIAFIITAAAIALLAILKSGKQTLEHLKKGAWLSAVCGLANGAVNLAVITLSQRMSASVMFPVISAGGIILTALISIFIYKENLSLFQKFGFVLGVLSIIFLNI